MILQQTVPKILTLHVPLVLFPVLLETILFTFQVPNNLLMRCSTLRNGRNNQKLFHCTCRLVHTAVVHSQIFNSKGLKHALIYPSHLSVFILAQVSTIRRLFNRVEYNYYMYLVSSYSHFCYFNLLLTMVSTRLEQPKLICGWNYKLVKYHLMYK